jgi:hypothetical protein
MEKKPIALSRELGISMIIFIQFFILSGNAKYGRPSTISKRPIRHINSFIFKSFRESFFNCLIMGTCNDMSSKADCQQMDIILDIEGHIIYLLIQLIAVYIII